MPLFIFPKKDRELVWPDTYLNEWSEQFTEWKNELFSGKLSATALETEMKEKKVYAMPWEDQLKLQWQFIVSGLEAI
ncbi:hypothetical protein D3C84_1138350 [compost metagenome]